MVIQITTNYINGEVSLAFVDTSILTEIGLTKIEAKVYLTLLEFGASLAGKITQKSGIHRRTVYDALERLIEKGLATYIKTNNRQYYKAVHPSRLKDILKEKSDRIETIMQSLEEKYNALQEQQETLFFKGREGLKAVFEDMIKKHAEILVLGASPDAYTILKYYFFKFDEERKKLHITSKLMFTEKARGIKELYKVPRATIKYLPNSFDNPMAINIYDNNVAIILWSEKNPFAILIRDKIIADSYKKHFELMWKIAKR